MLDEYLNFLQGKDSHSFWRKAKQREYTHDATDKISRDLTTDFDKLTTRNSITLRYLGFIVNKGKNKLEKTVTAQTYIAVSDKQRILDEQIMKVYLDCPEINDMLSIKIIPMYVILSQIVTIDYITLDEYMMFVCWITNNKEIPLVAKLILDFRKDQETARQHYVAFRKKISQLGIDDFKDNIKRLFDLLLTSSYFNKKERDLMVPSVSLEDIDIVRKGIDGSKFIKANYYNYLITNDGLNSDPYYNNLVKTLKTKSPKEKNEIIKGVLKELSLPPIGDVKPVGISLQIASAKLPRGATRKRRVYKKIDFEKRDATNRRLGNHAEMIVVKYEREILLSNGKIELVDKIQRVSLVDDSKGYDVLSFELNGREKHIEVKGVCGKPIKTFRFFMIENEIAIAKSDQHYYLYIVFDLLSINPSIFQMPNPFLKAIPGVTIYPNEYIVEVQL